MLYNIQCDLDTTVCYITFNVT